MTNKQNTVSFVFLASYHAAAHRLYCHKPQQTGSLKARLACNCSTIIIAKLQDTIHSFRASYHAAAHRLFGHKPQQTGSLKARLSCNFLNNSSSSWEVLVDPWPVEVLLSDPINRMFNDSRTMWVARMGVH